MRAFNSSSFVSVFALTAALALSGHVQAEGLQINPFPGNEAVQEDVVSTKDVVVHDVKSNSGLGSVHFGVLPSLFKSMEEEDRRGLETEKDPDVAMPMPDESLLSSPVSAPVRYIVNDDTGVDVSQIKDEMQDMSVPVLGKVATKGDDKALAVVLENVQSTKQNATKVIYVEPKVKLEEPVPVSLDQEISPKSVPPVVVHGDTPPPPPPSFVPVPEKEPRVFSNAQEFGIMLGPKVVGESVPAKFAEGAMVEVVRDESPKVIVEPQGKDPVLYDVAPKVVEKKIPEERIYFKNRPSPVVEPSVSADHVQGVYVARKRIVPVEEKNVPSLPKGFEEKPEIEVSASSQLIEPRAVQEPQGIVEEIHWGAKHPIVAPQAIEVKPVAEPEVKPVDVLDEAVVENTVFRGDLDREFFKSREWKSLSGYDLKEVLYNWSQRAGVALVWDADRPFTTLDPLRVQGAYQKAVELLLDQYADSVHKPVATIYMDSQTGQRYLAVQTN